jgi:hypothetical protein
MAVFLCLFCRLKGISKWEHMEMRARLLLNIGLVLECQNDVQKAIENIQNVCRTSSLTECEWLAILKIKLAEIRKPKLINFFETKGEHLMYSIPRFLTLSNTSLIMPPKYIVNIYCHDFA